MLMADALAITLSIVGFLLALNGLWLVCYAMFTPWVERAGERAARQPIRTFFVGAVLSALAILGTVVLAQGPAVMKVLSIGGVCAWLCYAQVGTAGIVTRIGRRLPSPADTDRPWKATLRGGISLSLAYVLPILGWFMILPASWITGAGAASLTLWKRRAKAGDFDRAVADLFAPTEVANTPIPTLSAREPVATAGVEVWR